LHEKLLAEQRDETGLLKVIVRSQRLLESALTHDDKRNTIRPTPVLVFPLTE
jgi:hypothetical protein